MKVYFCLILLLALSAIIDLHIKLRRTTMVIEDHEKPLVEVVVFCKMGPATPKVHLIVPVVPYLYLVGGSSSRVFAKNCFTKFSPIHESAAPVEFHGIERQRYKRRKIIWEKEEEKHYAAER
jgi:hypothetical protein